MSDGIKVRMPVMGEGVNEGTFVKWLKPVGTFVNENELYSKYQPIRLILKSLLLFWISVQSFVQEGASVRVHSVMGYLGKSLEDKIEPPQETSASDNSSPRHGQMPGAMLWRNSGAGLAEMERR